jgi:ligand-binding SRPBCC domain-containing protein
MLRFEKSSVIRAPLEMVFGFHERADVLSLLTPPWQKMEVVSRQGGLQTGARVVFLLHFGLVRVPWVAEHTNYRYGELFVDEQVEGPFRYWRHEHRFEKVDGGSTRLTDCVCFSLPGGAISDALGGWLAKAQLRRLFEYRHEVTRRSCEGARTS